MNDVLYRILRFISRLILGILFIFSGFVKVIDPLGFTYKFTDYFEAFGFHFLVPLAFVLAIVVSVAELLMGVCLILKLKMKVTSWAVLAFMVFFTILTFIIALTNPVTDCGCFGDALILTNWQTFYKNLIFLIPTIILFWQRNNFTDRYNTQTEWLLVGALALAGIVLSVHCYKNLPLIDFRPYKTGANIVADMEVPEGAPSDEYKTTLIYEKDGMQQEFDAANVPWQDTTWKWIETKNELISKGYEPPIHDFSLTDADGNDVTYDMLSDENYSLLVISYHIEKSSDKGWKNVLAFVDSLTGKHPVTPYIMTASTEGVVKEFNQKYQHNIPVYNSDDIMLKTTVRSNPGVMLLKRGTIIGKWHYNNVPVENFGKQDLLGECIKYQQKKSNRKTVHAFLLFLMITVIVIEFTSGNKFE